MSVFGPTRVSRPDPEVEKRASGSGDVVTRKMTPEEMARFENLKQLTNSDGKRIRSRPIIPGVETLREKANWKNREDRAEEKEMSKNTMTRTQYLQLRSEGRLRSHIGRENFTNTKVFYEKLNAWGLRDKETEIQVLLELKGSLTPQDAGSGTQLPDNQLKQKDAEIDVLREEIQDLALDKRNLEAVSERLQQELKRKEERVSELGRLVTGYQNKLKAAEAYAEGVPSDSVDQITLKIPVIDSGNDSLDQLEKVCEELREVTHEIDAPNIDRSRVTEELFDLIQALVGFIRTEMTELFVDNVDEQVAKYFSHFNREHIEKIKRYAAERGWTLTGEEQAG